MMWGKSRFSILLVAAISYCLIGGTTPAYADLGDQLFKLLPSDGGVLDTFGVSVAISSTTAIVGANMHSPSGSAYLFDTTTGHQLFELRDKDGSAFDQFGWSVAISGTTAIIGACPDGEPDGDNGFAYLFDTTSGNQLFMLLANDGAIGDRFGFSVAISGTTAIVGAVYDDDDNGLDSGSAYLFDISDPTNPTQITKLLPDDGAVWDVFGFSVAINGTTVIVGAPRDADNGGLSGSAYLFDTTTGQQTFKLLPNDGAQGDWFGWSVAISGTSGNEVAIVGAPFDEDNGFYSGSAYLFDVAAPGTCPWDMHGDGIVGPGDLLILLGWWGFDPQGPPDFDGDGNVSTIDLLELLANWGPCP